MSDHQQELKPVPELCNAVCSTHHTACVLHLSEHNDHCWHHCSTRQHHDFYADKDMYGNPIHTRKES